MTFDLKRLPVCRGGRLPLLEDEDENLPLSAAAATLLMLAELMLPEQQLLTFSMLAVLLWQRHDGLAAVWLLAGSQLFHLLSIFCSLSPSDPSLSLFSFFSLSSFSTHQLVFPTADLFLPLFFSFSNLVFLCLMNKINFCF